MGEEFLIPSYASPTTSKPVAIALVTDTIKSLVVIKLADAFNQRGVVTEYGVSFDAAADNEKIMVELVATDVAATTITSHVAGGIANTDPKANAVADDRPFDLSTNKTGYNATVEGTITAIRTLDPAQFISPAGLFRVQFPLGREPKFDEDDYVRLVAEAPAGVNVYGWIKVEL